MKKFVLLFILLLITSPLYSSTQTIKVGGYYFPPFLEQNEKNQYIGITIDLIAEMNKFQDEYLFKFVPTSPKRRFTSFDNGEYDLIMFEDIAWEWQGRSVTASKVILSGGEVYITQANETKNQDYFNKLKEKSIAVILGYHYGFNQLDSDEKHLKQHYNVMFTTSHERNINKVLSGRVDISVVTLSYLNNYLKRHPDVKEQLLISEKFDQEYHHTLLLRDNVQISIGQINQFLDEMNKAGILQKIWKKYGFSENEFSPLK